MHGGMGGSGKDGLGVGVMGIKARYPLGDIDVISDNRTYS